MENQNKMEEWKPIKGYENLYEVSNHGRARSLSFWQTYKNGVKRLKKGRVLKVVVSHTGYATIVVIKQGEKKKTLSMHQQVAIAFLDHLPDGHNKIVDHIDKNKSNNHVNNLRVISQRLNCSIKRKGATSKYIGVSFDKRSGKWRASYRKGNESKQTHIGSYTHEIDAHHAYQQALKEL